MKRIFLLVAITSLLGACNFMCVKGSGEVITENREVERFESIRFNGSGNLYLSKGKSNTIEIKTDKNIAELITATVEEGVLTIETKECISDPTVLDYYVSIPKIKDLFLNGSGKIIGQEHFRGKNIKLNIAGSGDIKLNVHSNITEVYIAGSGDVILKGACNEQEIFISGSGTIDAGEYSSKNAKVKITGSGNCELDVQKELDVLIAGSGDVIYSGNPKIETNLTGSGSVRKK